MSTERGSGFYLYVDLSEQWATIHRSKCRHAARQTRHGNLPGWTGPYATRDETLRSAQTAGMGRILDCKICKPARLTANASD
jgi:hypothetical protein